MSLGDIIRTQRKKINLTLPQLAQLSDVSKGVISKIETEETKRPDFKTIYAIGRALNMTYEDIVKIYLTFETRSDFLMNILKQSVTESPYLCFDIAKRFLNDFQRDCYELVDELYSFIETILNPTIQLNLYKRYRQQNAENVR